MYYNSNKTNSDYYNTYKEEMLTLEDYHEEFSFQKIIKIGFTILMIGVISISAIYLINYFSTENKKIITIDYKKEIRDNLTPKVALSKEMLPKSIQTEEKKINISSKDIALIAEIILAQVNYKKDLLLQEQLLSSEKSKESSKTLEESNHYNKVIVSDIDNPIDMKESLDNILGEDIKFFYSSYEEEIKKEIDIRSNEMRIIIVQEGDTLSKIAKKAYGDFDSYTKILIANPEIAKNPNEIFVGQRLRIPA